MSELALEDRVLKAIDEGDIRTLNSLLEDYGNVVLTKYFVHACKHGPSKVPWWFDDQIILRDLIEEVPYTKCHRMLLRLQAHKNYELGEEETKCSSQRAFYITLVVGIVIVPTFLLLAKTIICS